MAKKDTRRSNALAILSQIKAGSLREHDLSIDERRACVAYLRLEGLTQEEIAEVFGVHRHTIARDEQANLEAAKRLVDGIDARAAMGGLIAWGKHLTAKALKGKDYALAWRIQRELVAELRELGFLKDNASGDGMQCVILKVDDGVPYDPDPDDPGPKLLPAPEEAE